MFDDLPPPPKLKLRERKRKKRKIKKKLSVPLPRIIVRKPEEEVKQLDKLIHPPAEELPKEVPPPRKVIWEPFPGPQIDFLSADEDEVLFAGGRGPLAYGEQVLTPYGFKNIEDISVGSQVICSDGSTSEVIAIPFEGNDDCYELEFIDGRKVIVGKSHLWNIEVSNRTLKEGSLKQRIKTTEWIVEHFNKNIKNADKKDIRHILIPLTSPIEFNPQNSKYKIEPYLLGLLLGDGCLRNEAVTLTNIDQEIVEYCKIDNKISYDGKTINFLNRKDLREKLKEIGIYGHLANTKFIPEAYKKIDLESRWQLLRGLMDTDGTVDKTGHLSYTSVSKQLAEDVQWIVRSLGGKATITSKVGSYKDKNNKKINCQIAYTLYIQIENAARCFNLTRKKKRCKDSFNGGVTYPKLRLKNVTHVGVRGCKCITIDHPAGLFLTNDFIVTHNSGKSDAFLIDPLRYVSNPRFRGLILRRTMPELKDLIRGAKELYFQAFPSCRWREQEKMFLFPSGASIDFGYLDTVDDVERYRGQEYTWLGIDEISQFPDINWYYRLKGSIRTTDPTLRTKIRATCNPTGVGRNWVKEYWIDQGEPNTTILEEIDSPFGKLRLTKKWIHSSIKDNPALMASPQYLAVLATLQEPLRSAWLDGSWDAVEGMAFPEFRKDTHVIEPFKIPSNWVKFRGADWGYSSPAVCLWLAVDYDNNIYVYREFACNGSVSKARYEEPLTADLFGRKIVEIELGDMVRYGVLDVSCWANKGDAGPSIAEAMEMERCFWRQSDRSAKQRESGKLEMHRLLKCDVATKKPKIFIFNTCKETIKCLASLPVDESNPEDVDTKANDHCFHKDTEILTKVGWKNITEVSIGEEVISLTKDNSIEYQPVIDTTKIFKDKICTYRSTALDFSVTDNHKLCVLSQYKYKRTEDRVWELRELKDCTSSMHIPRSGNWHGVDMPITIGDNKVSNIDFNKFLGIWLAEGCSGVVKGHYKVIVDQKKFKKEVVDILSKLPFHFSEYTNKAGCTRYTANSKALYEYLNSLNLINKHSHEKFIPRDFIEGDKASLEALFYGLMLGDGCWQKRGSHYDTTSKQLADDFQELCLKVGYVGSIKSYNKKITNKTTNGRDIYRIYLRNKGNNYVNFFKKHIKEEIYNDFAHCVVLPKNHTVFTRFNGKPMWVGQSWDALRYALMSRPSIANTWDDWLKTAKDKPTIVDPTFGY